MAARYQSWRSSGWDGFWGPLVAGCHEERQITWIEIESCPKGTWEAVIFGELRKSAGGEEGTFKRIKSLPRE